MTECTNLSTYRRHFTLNPWYSYWKRKKRQLLNSAEKIAYPHAKKKNGIRSVSLTLPTKRLKMSQRPEGKTWNIKIAREKHT